MDEAAIRKLLRWDSSYVKRRLRAENSLSVYTMALWLEVHARRPRQGLVKWLFPHIAALSGKKSSNRRAPLATR